MDPPRKILATLLASPADLVQDLQKNTEQSQLDEKDLQKNTEQSQLDEKETKRAKKAQQKDFPHGIPECGTDALRFTLCSHNFKGDAIHFDVVRATTNRHFCNKVWQAFRFMSRHIGEDFTPDSQLNASTLPNIIDQWILSRLSHLISTCDDHIKGYNFYLVTRALRQFWHHELCDVYLECIKSTLNNGNPDSIAAVHQVLYRCFDVGLRLLSPFMPYLTEELYQRLPGTKTHRADSVCVVQYPQPNQFDWRDESIESDVEEIRDISTHFNNLRKDLNIKQKTPAILQVSDEASVSRLSPYQSALQAMSRVSDVTIQCEPPVSDGWVTATVKPSCQLHLFVKDLVNVDIELDRLSTQHTKLVTQLNILTKSAANSTDAHQTDAKITKCEEDIKRITDL